MPNEWGKKKHPLFIIPGFSRWHQKQQLKKKKEILQKLQEIQEKEGNQFQANVEEVDFTLKEKEKNNQTVNIYDLCKVYPNGKQAVSSLNLTIYKDQIFVLLGHNGMKSTHARTHSHLARICHAPSARPRS